MNNRNGRWWEEYVLTTLRAWGYEAEPHDSYKDFYDVSLSRTLLIEVKSSKTRRGVLYSVNRLRLDRLYIAVACWGPITEFGAEKRCLVITPVGRYPFTEEGFKRALADLGYPTEPDELHAFLVNLSLSLSFTSSRWEHD